MYPKNTPALLDNSAGQRLSIESAQSQHMPRRSRRESGRLVQQA